jgi:biotin carboxylase
MLLVIGWRPEVEQELNCLGIPHTTLVEPEKWAEAAGLRPETVSLAAIGDCRDVEQLLAAVHRDCAADEIRGVYTWHEFYQVAAAALAASLGVPTAQGAPAALLFRDKYLQKQALARAGVATAAQVPLGALAPGRRETLSALGQPLVIKPSLDASANLAEKLTSRDDLNGFAARIAESGAGHTLFHAEEFIDGTEMHLDGVLRGGEPYLLSISRYTENLLRIRDGAVVGSVLLDPSHHERTYDELHEYAVKVLGVLGMRDGVFHLEFFETAEGYVVGECASRPGGGMIVAAVKRKFGADLWAEHARAALGVTTSRRAALSQMCVGWTLLPAPQGLIRQLPTAEEVLAQDGVVDVALNVSAGDHMGDMRKSTHVRAGLAMLETDDETSLRTAMASLVAWFSSRVNVERESS